jgi:hypothetical protein
MESIDTNIETDTGKNIEPNTTKDGSILGNIINKINWHHQQEIILKEWAEIASSYRWMHDRAHRIYKKKHMNYTIPVIIMSTLTGAANFTQTSFPQEYSKGVPLVIGGINIISAIVATISQFLKIAEFNEGHKIATISYSKLSRNIRMELSLPLYERTINGQDMIKSCKSEIDRLIEQGPQIPVDVLKNFHKKFNNKRFVKPEILDIHSANIFNDCDNCRWNDNNNTDVDQKFQYSINNVLKDANEKDIELLRKQIGNIPDLLNDKINNVNKFENSLNANVDIAENTFKNNNLNNNLNNNFNLQLSKLKRNKTISDLSQIKNESLYNNSTLSSTLNSTLGNTLDSTLSNSDIGDMDSNDGNTNDGSTVSNVSIISNEKI